MMTLTIEDEVLDVEVAKGKITWVAFKLKDSPWKVILKGKVANESLKEIEKGSQVLAWGSVVKYEDGIFKLFADGCMKSTRFPLVEIS